MTECLGSHPSTADPTDHRSDGDWAGDWVLDPDESSVRFGSTSVWGLVKVTGRFTTLRGAGSLDRAGTATGTLVIDGSSVDTGNKRRDTHLRSDHFFDTATHPEITYTVASITPDGQDRVRIVGELTVVDTTRPLEVSATIDGADTNAATLSIEVELNRSSWGIDFNKLGAVGTTTRLDVRLRFTRR